MRVQFMTPVALSPSSYYHRVPNIDDTSPTIPLLPCQDEYQITQENLECRTYFYTAFSASAVITYLACLILGITFVSLTLLTGGFVAVALAYFAIMVFAADHMRTHGKLEEKAIAEYLTQVTPSKECFEYLRRHEDPVLSLIRKGITDLDKQCSDGTRLLEGNCTPLVKWLWKARREALELEERSSDDALRTDELQAQQGGN
jgi:hypothetical protein